jgi:hypothetical protein
MTTSAAGRTPLSTDLDRLSLEQALLDADIATARAHELALRLVELQSELADERMKVAALHGEVERVQGLYDEIVNNRAYGLATKMWAVRRVIGG